MSGPGPHPRLLVPEVVQTSSTDCGPAALKCLLEGFGIRADYDRLREICRTDVDGTSIDTLEELAGELGLEARQIMVPLDHLLLREARNLPAIVVTRLPDGVNHFVVAWRRHGRLVQVMDPATGRRWPACRRFLEEVYVHTFPVSPEKWRAWAGSPRTERALRELLAGIGVSRAASAHLVRNARADPEWRHLAALDASIRLVRSLVRSGGLPPGRALDGVLRSLLERARENPGIIPDAYWSVRSASAEEGGGLSLMMRGAVLVQTLGRTSAAPETAGGAKGAEGPGTAQPSPARVAALKADRIRPGRHLLRVLREDGVLAPAALASAIALGAAAVLLEALVFRALIDGIQDLGPPDQRLAAIVAVIGLVAFLMLLELPVLTGTMRLGRHLELRLRKAFLEKLPRIGDRYFQSRIRSDMVERTHSLHTTRTLPEIGGQLTGSTFELIFTVAGIAWLDPKTASLAILAALVAVVLPLLAQPALMERDLRMRSHGGALSRFYLDALLGLVPARTHGAERAVRRAHGSLLREWIRAGVQLQRATVVVEGVQSFVAFGLAAWILFDHLARGGEVGAALLLVYWALNLPALGEEIAFAAWQYPESRSITHRILELMGAPEESPPDEESRGAPRHAGGRGMALTFDGVDVRVGGHTILRSVSAEIESGAHVAILGKSGSGKSTLVGVPLGWHRPASGACRVDGELLTEARLQDLRRETAWVDPTIHLWNRSLLENLHYGAPPRNHPPMTQVLGLSELAEILEKLPDGLQSPLGESGSLLSGGEGQRVRLARATLRPDARLVILDESFRGLDRDVRRRLLRRAREWWRNATLLCVTHDIGETLSFDRILILEEGRIVEDGEPTALARRSDSRYHAYLQADRAVRETLWAANAWRRLRLRDGQLTEEAR